MDNNIIPEDTDNLLLTNDSLYGPLFPLEPIIERMQARTDIDFWGLTDSYQQGWYVQSYFLWLTRKIFVSDSFERIFKQGFSPNLGGIELAKSLSDAGFKGAALIPHNHLSQNVQEENDMDPTHFFWDRLIEHFGFPFVSKELILQNPENIQSTAKLFPFIREHSSYPIENIKQSISRYIALFDSSNKFPDKISVICHLYYPGSVYYFLTKIIALKSSNTQFVFNLSVTLYHNTFFCEMLTKYFPNAIVLFTPNQGRDIGGKLAGFDSLMKCGIQTEYTLIIHDKLSPHSPTGIDWRNKLLRVLSPEALPKVFKKFQQNREVGVITAKEFVQNEFNPAENRFTCTSDENILHYLKKYKLSTSDYNFAAGTIFWIRTEILRNFFLCYSPLSVRKEFEKGNTLDFNKGTNIHAWERLFSFIAHSQGFKTLGI
jgi:lipopolysaccharide biosynthesis protein